MVGNVNSEHYTTAEGQNEAKTTTIPAEAVAMGDLVSRSTRWKD